MSNIENEIGLWG